MDENLQRSFERKLNIIAILLLVGVVLIGFNTLGHLLEGLGIESPISLGWSSVNANREWTKFKAVYIRCSDIANTLLEGQPSGTAIPSLYANLVSTCLKSEGF